MSQVATNMVLENEASVQNGACFYCKNPVGQPHKSSCVSLRKKVKVAFTIELECEVPHDWTKDEIEFHYGESSWCASNIIGMLQEREKAGCLCGDLSSECIDAAMDAAPFVEVK